LSEYKDSSSILDILKVALIVVSWGVLDELFEYFRGSLGQNLVRLSAFVCDFAKHRHALETTLEHILFDLVNLHSRTTAES
jgi:hypothetical protein